MTKAELIDELWNDALQVAKGFRLGIDSICESKLKAFITHGVDVLEREGLLNNSQRLEEAEIHLIAFVGGMAHEAKTLKQTTLTGGTFIGVRASFCPLWPFC